MKIRSSISRSAIVVGISVAAVAMMSLAGCSSDDAADALPKRGCARVATNEISEIVGTDVTLEKAGKEPGRCTYVDQDGKTIVELQVVKPVEAGAAKLTLTDPEQVKDLGTETWVSQTNAPLGTIVMARRKGALLQVDLGTGASKAVDEKRAIAIARAGVENLPDVKVAKADGPRGAEACEVFEAPEIAVLMAGAPKVTTSPPPGSCTLTSADREMFVVYNLLVPKGATSTSLDDMVANAADVEELEVLGRPARWVPPLGELEEGGQLDVLDGDRLFQVAVAGASEGTPAKELAVGIAEVALGD